MKKFQIHDKVNKNQINDYQIALTQIMGIYIRMLDLRGIYLEFIEDERLFNTIHDWVMDVVSDLEDAGYDFYRDEKGNQKAEDVFYDGIIFNAN